MSSTTVRTPLYSLHIEYGASLAPFMGCLMPVDFGNADAEHIAVRTEAGLFDANHRCEAIFRGADVLKNLENLLCSSVSSLQEGYVCRSLMLNLQGGVMDDVQIYHTGENEYRLAMHTLNREKDLRHIRRQLTGDVEVTEAEDECRLSLDGPKARRILAVLAEAVPDTPGQFIHTHVNGIPCRITYIGFAGEEGYGLCCAAADGKKLYRLLVEKGVCKCGTRSFHSLRLEAGHSLYGMEMDDAVSPLETGFRRLVQLEKRSFVGRDALIAAGEPRRARIGLILREGVADCGMAVIHRDKEVGSITSGAYCPYLGVSAALALVETPYRETGRTLRVEAGNQLLEATVVELPFYSRS